MSKPQQIRDHIAYFLQDTVKAYEIDAVCDRLGMPVVENAWTYNSKRVYVQNRLAGVPAAKLMQIARCVIMSSMIPSSSSCSKAMGFEASTAN